MFMWRLPRHNAYIRVNTFMLTPSWLPPDTESAELSYLLSWWPLLLKQKSRSSLSPGDTWLGFSPGLQLTFLCKQKSYPSWLKHYDSTSYSRRGDCLGFPRLFQIYKWTPLGFISSMCLDIYRYHIGLSSLLYNQWREAGTSVKRSASSHPDVNCLHRVEKSPIRKDGYYSFKKIL